MKNKLTIIKLENAPNFINERIPTKDFLEARKKAGALFGVYTDESNL